MSKIVVGNPHFTLIPRIRSESVAPWLRERGVGGLAPSGGIIWGNCVDLSGEGDWRFSLGTTRFLWGLRKNSTQWAYTTYVLVYDHVYLVTTYRA